MLIEEAMLVDGTVLTTRNTLVIYKTILYVILGNKYACWYKFLLGDALLVGLSAIPDMRVSG